MKTFKKYNIYVICSIHAAISWVLAFYLIWFQRSDFHSRLGEISAYLVFLVHWGILFLLGVPLIYFYIMYEKEKKSVYHLDPDQDHRLEIVSVLVELLREKDPAIESHAERVADASRRVCNKLNVSASESRVIIFAAMFHDIGKLFIHPALFYGDRVNMTPQEKQEYNFHAVYGQKVIAKVSSYPGADLIIRHHHERWDGTGFPDALSHSEIPLGARIIAVADAYDAMVNGLNSMRRHYDPEDAISEIRRAKEQKYDPQIVDVFEKMFFGAEL